MIFIKYKYARKYMSAHKRKYMSAHKYANPHAQTQHFKYCHCTLGKPLKVLLAVGSWGFLVYELGQASFRPHTSCTNSYDGWTNSPQRLARGLP